MRVYDVKLTWVKIIVLENEDLIMEDKWTEVIYYPKIPFSSLFFVRSIIYFIVYSVNCGTNYNSQIKELTYAYGVE